LSVGDQVAIIYAGTKGYLDDIDADKVVSFLAGLRDYMKSSTPRYAEVIATEKKLNDEAEGVLKGALEEYKKTFMATA